MAYTKPQLVCQDQAVSFQSVNTLQTDLDTHWLNFTLRHGSVELSSGPFGVVIEPPPTRRFGQHNDVRIPRASLAITGSALSTGMNASWASQSNEPSVCGRPRRVDVGVVEVEVSLSDFYAEAWPKASGGVGGAARLVVPISVFASQGATASLRFELYEEQGGVMTPTDFDFWAHVYGSP